MLSKSILTAAAIALVAGFGSASADENFGTLDGISGPFLVTSTVMQEVIAQDYEFEIMRVAGLGADRLTVAELAAVRGAAGIHIRLGTIFHTDVEVIDTAPLVLCSANECILQSVGATTTFSH